MSLYGEIKTLFHLLLQPIRGKSHQERLESFYAGQALHYDSFRKRLLHGREELWSLVDVQDGDHWVDFGGGTGANAENLGQRIHKLSRYDVVDLSPSLLEVADQRIADRGWHNVNTHCCDVTKFVPENPVDVVSFSYSLTMIPNWFAAIENAFRILRPGGVVAVVDFYVSRKYPDAGRRKHGGMTRGFWPQWFGRDNRFFFRRTTCHISNGVLIRWTSANSVGHYRSCRCLPFRSTFSLGERQVLRQMVVLNMPRLSKKRQLLSPIPVVIPTPHVARRDGNPLPPT